MPAHSDHPEPPQRGLWVVTWMYSSPPGENILHHQVGRRSSSARVQAFYWRCVFVLFESSARHNPGARHLLFVNRPPPPVIDGIDTTLLMRQLHIELVLLERLTLAPPDYHSAWNTQFLVLDILDVMARRAAGDDSVLILDADMIFHRPFDQAWRARVAHLGALLYSLEFDEDADNNGLTGRQLLALARELDPAFAAPRFVYSGGELVACRGDRVGTIAADARAVFEQCLERHRQGLRKFNEEAHLLSFVYHRHGYATHTANDLVRRIWTDRTTYCDARPAEDDALVLWHLPSEKRHGFVKAFRAFQREGEVYRLVLPDPHRTYRLRESVRDRWLRLALLGPWRRLRGWLILAARRCGLLR